MNYLMSIIAIRLKIGPRDRNHVAGIFVDLARLEKTSKDQSSKDEISLTMEDSDETDTPRCGEKRNAPNSEKMTGKEKSQKKPWGTDGPPPPEWIEVRIAKDPFNVSR